jgi:hypothetical protein
MAGDILDISEDGTPVAKIPVSEPCYAFMLTHLAFETLDHPPPMEPEDD